MKKTCWCGAIAAALIIILTWFWETSLANIGITILAVILLLTGLFGCCCKDKCKSNVSTPPTPPVA